MSSKQGNQILYYKVGIIGAGISGIAAAKQLSKYSPVVFEATDSIGGVWKHCSYHTTKLQTPSRAFEFSDYPWPNRDTSSLPSYIEVLEYLHGYATHFDVLRFVKFNSKVVEISYIGAGHEVGPEQYGTLLPGHPVWRASVETESHVQSYAFEFLVICTGKYGDIPRRIVYPPNKGPEIFNGKVMHSTDYSKLGKDDAEELLKGKKVALIGFKKSAIDLATECAEANKGQDGQPCTMVIRTLHWVIPSYRIWGLPFFLFYSTRASQFLHERPNQGLFRDILCSFLSPVRRIVSKIVESYLVWKLPLAKYGLKPEHPFQEDSGSCQISLLPENFFPQADKGKILFKKASEWWFWNNGIEFNDKTRLEADIVILCTGYDGKKKLQDIISEPFRSLMLDSTGIMPLYRGTIHPRIPNMAFVGYIESLSNLHTAELRCKWLSRLIDGHFKLPSIPKMIQQTTREIEIAKRTTRFYKRHCITTFSINHSDEICQEMGWSSWRKKNWILEAFSPYGSQDYNEIRSTNKHN